MSNSGMYILYITSPTVSLPPVCPNARGRPEATVIETLTETIAWTGLNIPY